MVLAVCLLAGQAFADSAEAIRDLDAELAVATWSGDAEWFEQHLADDYQLVTPSGSLRSKRDVIRDLATPGLRMEPYEPFDVNVRMYGDAAVLNGRALQRFTIGDVQYVNDMRYTSVWVKKKSRWWLVSAHASLVGRPR
jgi:ketosteroid isomerase-like protein